MRKSENRHRNPNPAARTTPRGFVSLIVLVPVIAALITATCATLIVFRMTEARQPPNVHVVSAFRVYLNPRKTSVLAMVWSDGEVWTADASIDKGLENWTPVAGVRKETE